MLNGALDSLGEAIIVNMGLWTEGFAILEVNEIETFKDKSFISEINEVRVNEDCRDYGKCIF